MSTPRRKHKAGASAARAAGDALLVFLRGVNVGGHRSFRPSRLVESMRGYDLVNIGAAGSFVARNVKSKTKFLAELRGQLPFVSTIGVCNRKELVELVSACPFAGTRRRADIIHFVSVLTELPRRRVRLPLQIPENGPWMVRILGAQGPFVYGVHRRKMKAIGCLGRIDTLFGVPATTRSFTTLLTMLKVEEAACA
jgi:hypothetical protein